MSEETKMTVENEPAASGEKIQPKKKADALIKSNILKDESSKDETASFADILYDQITSVIGGDNPNQFFLYGTAGNFA